MGENRDAGERARSSPDKDEKEDRNCIVCCREARIFSIGACDHPVCYECSTRMRVLCGKNECPICRKVLKKVVFTRRLIPYDKEFKNKRFHCFEREFGIGFEDEGIWDNFDRLLQFRCPICDARRRRATFNNFHQLRRHVQKEHERFFCDLCVEHLKVFNHERKCYTREELTEHRRRGDADDTSHRGHPLCKFCDQRFIDNDELYRHVRRDHFFCHFCDSDEAANHTGKNIVFSDYDYLRAHFQHEHFLCEEGRCKEERFVNAFRTELDLKAHKMKEHMSQASKATAKQTRTLELEFSVARSGGGIRDSGGGRGRGDRGGGRDRDRDGGRDRDGRDGGPGGRRRGGPRNAEAEESRFRDDFDALGGGGGGPPPAPERDEFVNLENTADFPSLGAATRGAPEPARNGPTQAAINNPSRRNGPESTYVGRAAKNMMREEDFPSLSATVPKHSSAPATNSVNITISSRQGGGQKSGRPAGVSVEYSRSVTVPIAAPMSTSAAPQARVTRISSTQNIRMESPVGVSPQVVSQGAPTLGSIGQHVGGWSGAASAPRGGGVARGNSKGVTIPNGREAFPTLGPPEKLLPSHTFASKTKQTKSNGSAWAKKTQEIKKPPASSESVDHTEEPKKGSIVLSRSKPHALDSVRPSLAAHKLPDAGSDSDFPSLGIAKPLAPSSGAARRLPPPPGFDFKKIAAKGASKASTTASASAPSPTELTFTNSSGQRFTLNTWDYHKPRDFDGRSEDLTKRIRRDALRGDVDLFNDFAAVSASYLAGGISARGYYSKCTFYFGDQFGKVFPEFLALLPSIGKQGELLEAHEEVEERRNAVEEDFFNCPVCRQVVLARDYEDHADYHGEEENFPKLG